jgi:hypothetical protein
MLDPLSKDLIALDRVPKRLPERLHRHSVFRWHAYGKLDRSGRRVYLRAIKIGKKLYTNEESLREFLLAVNSGGTGDAQLNTTKIKDRARKAKKRLAKLGV